jgi:hypothetical protein
MFFVFAKNETKQKYQIYVGNGFDVNSVKAVRPNLLGFPIQTLQEGNAWPREWVKYDPGSSILEVTVSFEDQKDYRFKTKPPEEAPPEEARKILPEGLCQPRTFCKRGKEDNNDGCTCALEESDPLVKASPTLLNACKNVCNEWAVKDLDYPQQGPIGFSFTLPPGFQAQDQGLKSRPAPQLYPSNASAGDGKPNWDTKFSRTQLPPDKGGPGSNCYYSQLPLRGGTCGASGR